jgi:hypothetical protein
MGNDLFKQLRKAFFVGSIFSGASSLSKVFNETEDELEDMIKYVDKKVKTQKIFENKLFKNGKY